jgi:hypothetical protein
MVRLCRDPWVPWTTFAPFRAIDPDLRAATYGTDLEPRLRRRPPFLALLWVRAADGTVRRLPLEPPRR